MNNIRFLTYSLLSIHTHFFCLFFSKCTPAAWITVKNSSRRYSSQPRGSAPTARLVMFVERLMMMKPCYFVTLAILDIIWFVTPLPWWKSLLESGNARSAVPRLCKPHPQCPLLLSRLWNLSPLASELESLKKTHDFCPFYRHICIRIRVSCQKIGKTMM